MPDQKPLFGVDVAPLSAPSEGADEPDMTQPLPARVRPRTLDEVVGQEHLVGEGKLLRRMIEADRVSSMIFWGPPGVGKTTLARVIAHQTSSAFIDFSAVTSGIKEIRKVMEEAESYRQLGRRTILFVDEIHRFNKAQQDAFLPYVERGSIVLIGATTENPSFEVNGALLSRCRVFVLHELGEDDLVRLMRNALADPRGFGDEDVRVSDEQLSAIARFSNGDARGALSTLEMVVINSPSADDGSVTVGQATLEQCISRKALLYDKRGEEHYNIISALHKSMRNSDPDAAVYWLARMLEGGEDPLYVARRVTRFAAEDIGLADPRAAQVAGAAAETFERLGSPEGELALAEAVIYLAMAAKSNAAYVAYNAARAFVAKDGSRPVPLHLRNAPTKLMKDLDYGKHYRYAHDEEGGFAAGENYFPEGMPPVAWYKPVERGLEIKIGEKLAQLRELDRKAKAEKE